jgi:tRNA uridine 5-carboxymethylaminomethyl modification enzyme
MVFEKETSVSPEEANPILQSKDTALITQGDKMFKVFSRPQIDLRHHEIEKVVAYVVENDLDQEILEQTEIHQVFRLY